MISKRTNTKSALSFQTPQQTDVGVGCHRQRRFALPLVVTAALLCALASRPAHGQIAWVQDLGIGNTKTAGTSLSLPPLGSAVTDRNSIIVTFAMDEAAGAVSCSDDSGGAHTYNVDVDVANAGTVRTVICSAHNVDSVIAGTIITVTHPNATARSMSATEFTGLAKASTLDQTATGTGDGTVQPMTTAATPLTTWDHELLIGAFGVEGPPADTFTPTSPWNALPEDGTSGGGGPDTQITIDPEYQVVYSTGTYQASGNNDQTRNWAGAIATYKSEYTAVFSKVGTFTASGIAQSVTGVGFQPRAVIFFWTPQTAAGFASHVAAGYGFAADDLNQRAVVFAEDDNRTTTNFNGQSIQTTSGCILVATGTPPSGGATTRAQLTAMTSDGFDLSWSVAPPSAYLIHYLAFGGGDVTDATVGTQKPAAGTGSEAFTGVGFQPDFLMFLSIDNDTNDAWVTGGGTYTGAKVSIGFAGDSGGAITQGAITATAMARGQVNAIDTAWQQSDSTADRAILERNTRTSAAGNEFEARVTSFDADGFTLDKITNTAGTETNFHYLALKGGRYDVSPFNKPAATGPQSYTGVGFMPRGLLFFSFNSIASTGIGAGSGRISFSAVDSLGLNQRATFFATQTDNPADFDNSWVRQATSTSKIIYLAQPGDCPSAWPEGANPLQCSAGPRLIADADVTSYDADGFTLNWTTVDTVNVNSPANENNCEIVCLAFGNTTTAVNLISFTAQELDGEVEIRWETGSEIDNLGFNLYRSTSEEGTYARITSRLIPGLGSSPEGAKYHYRDRGLTNGVTYYYKLEDIETTGKTEMHGPVSATPAAGAGTCCGGQSEGVEESRITVGDPSSNELRVLEERPGEVVLELLTGGFYAEPQEGGTVKLDVPGYALTSDEGYPSLPVKKTWVEALAGRKVQIVGVEASEEQGFDGLVPFVESGAEVVASPRGTVHLRRGFRLRQGSGGQVRAIRTRRSRRASAKASAFAEASADKSAGLRMYPEEWARLVSVGYQGDVKKALVELAPLRWDGKTNRLVLAHRLVVRLSFHGRDLADRVREGRARRYRRRASHEKRQVLTRLVTKEKGLYGVSFQDVFERRRSIPASAIRLSRQGEPVAFHLSPDTGWFAPGVTLYFLSEGSAANPYGQEAVYELETGVSGERMALSSAAPSGAEVNNYRHTVEKEENRLYQATLVEAPDRWLWSVLFAPARESYPFDVNAWVPTAGPSHLHVWLQGTSDFKADPDHHVRVYVNGVVLDETSWDGKTAETMDIEIPPGVLKEGENTLEIENVGDTEASYSMVMLNRFRMTYPRTPLAESGRLEGRWSQSGTAHVSGVNERAALIEMSASGSVWLTGMDSTAGGVRFRAEAGARYLVTSPEAVLPVEIRKPVESRLKEKGHRADYVLIGPRAFMEAAKPLLEHRRSQGLRVKGVALEEVYSEFGFGEESPRAIREFLSYAYHEWRVGPRYVLLLGDGTYDFKDYLGTGLVNQVPPLLVETTYLETASDPTYAAVNGEDILPDLAIGRLPASTVDELQKMIAKLLTFETSGRTLGGRTVLVTDNPDEAGDFVSNAEELASTVLSTKELEKIYLSELGRVATRREIQHAFNEGSSLMSYIGHGGIHLWADENILNIYDTASMTPQSEQPMVLTMNCLNGYFHFPYFNALAEELLKVEDKGAIAAFSPSGLSLNEAAHVLHRALLEELMNGNHQRLGDAVLAAQSAYAETGAFPEMLVIYHLFGDPALRLR